MEEMWRWGSISMTTTPPLLICLANLFQNSTEVSSPLESHQIETSFLLRISLYYYYYPYRQTLKFFHSKELVHIYSVYTVPSSGLAQKKFVC